MASITCVSGAAVLSKRSFPEPHTAYVVEKGYREAPGVESDMAIVFVRVSGPVMFNYLFYICLVLLFI